MPDAECMMKSSAKRSVALARQLCSAARGHGRDPYAAGSKGLVIYGPPTSRVCKVRWAAAEAQQSFETVPDMFPERRSPWYLELNPKGTVPTLRDGDLIINESNSAVMYLLHRFADCSSSSALLPLNDPALLATAWQWAEWAEGVLAPAQNLVFFPIVRGTYAPAARRGAGAGAGRPSDAEVEAAVAPLAAAWRVLDTHLAGAGHTGGARAPRDYILGPHFSFADFTAAVQANRLIRNDGFGFSDLLPSLFPAVSAWYDRIKERPAFAEYVLPNFT